MKKCLLLLPLLSFNLTVLPSQPDDTDDPDFIKKFVESGRPINFQSMFDLLGNEDLSLDQDYLFLEQ